MGVSLCSVALFLVSVRWSYAFFVFWLCAGAHGLFAAVTGRTGATCAPPQCAPQPYCGTRAYEVALTGSAAAPGVGIGAGAGLGAGAGAGMGAGVAPAELLRSPVLSRSSALSFHANDSRDSMASVDDQGVRVGGAVARAWCTKVAFITW